MKSKAPTWVIYMLFIQFIYVLTPTVYGQDEAIIIQGNVMTQEHRPLELVNIVCLNRGKGTISNADGDFSLGLHAGDTVQFSRIGFYPRIIYIDEKTIALGAIVDLVLVSETYMLKDVDVFPWKTYSEFKEAFSEAKSTESKQKADENIDQILHKCLTMPLPLDFNDYHKLNVSKYGTFNNGMVQTFGPSTLGPRTGRSMSRATRERLNLIKQYQGK